MTSPQNTRARLCLRVAIFLQVWGFYLIVFGRSSAVNTTLFINLDRPEQLAIMVDQGAALILILLGAASAWWPKGALLWPIAIWMMVVASLEVLQGAKPFAQWSLIAWAVRYCTPLVLWLWYSKKDNAYKIGMWIARIGLALTFFAHGVESLSPHPRFIDLLSSAWHMISGQWLDQGYAQTTLTIIGIVDIVCAFLILVPKLTRWVGAYMAFWGCVTALSRIVEWGTLGIGATLLRAGHGLLPLALWFAFKQDSNNETPDES